MRNRLALTSSRYRPSANSLLLVHFYFRMWWNVKDDGLTKTKIIFNETSETLFKKKGIKLQREIDNLCLNSKNARIYIQIFGVQRDIPQFKLD